MAVDSGLIASEILDTARLKCIQYRQIATEKSAATEELESAIASRDVIAIERAIAMNRRLGMTMGNNMISAIRLAYELKQIKAVEQLNQLLQTVS